MRRLHSQTLAVDIMMNVERVTTGSARRRRERRLRSMLRHERMSVAMALAEKLHHSACRSVPLKEELVEHEMHNAPRGQKTASGRGTEFFDVFDEELVGGRPPPLPEVAGPQARVLRRTVEPIIESFVPVQMIDVPVPQSSMGGVLDQILQRTADIVPEEVILVIAVPKISSLPCPPPRRVLPVPQTAEQLVEVPTNPGYALAVVASKVFLRREILGILSGLGVPQGRGGGGARGGLQGSRAGQNSTAYLEQISEIPQDRREGGGGVQGSLPVQNSEAVVEQIVDIPARRGLPDFLPGQGSSASSSSRLHDDADEDFTGFFALFPVRKKCEVGLALGVGTAPRVEPIHAASL